MAKSKPLYHSKLREWGATLLRFKSDPRDGKYGPYCFVQVQGDEDDRLFNIDSDHVKEEIERTRATVGDDWVLVQAEGMKDGATIRVTDADGGPGPVLPESGDTESENYEPQGQPVPKPQPSPGNNGYPGSKVNDAATMTVEACKLLRDAGIPVDGDAAARIYNTHFIQVSR